MNWLDFWTDLTWVGLIASLIAGVVRGFSGFGFSALTVAGVSLFMNPSAIIPAVLILEIVASLSVWRSAVREIDAGWLKTLIIGNLLCIPIGAYLLAHLDALTTRISVGAVLLLTASLLRYHSTHTLQASARLKHATGALSGILNGLAASGGVAAALMMAACHVPPGRLRSTIVVFLVFGSSYTLLWASLFSMGSSGNVEVFSRETVRWTLVLLPGLLIGMAVGRRAFLASNQARFRLLVLNLLILISGLGFARAVQELVTG